MKITEPGLYTMTAEAYHADPCPEPSLSNSIAKELISQSAWHAFHAHPRLNPAYQREDEDKFDLGTAVHAYLLEGETGFAIVNATDWRTAAAKAAKADARVSKKTPLLAEQWQRVQQMVAALHPQLDAHQDPPRPLSAGKPEQTLIWREGETWFRIRMDWLHDDLRTIDDFKSTGATANPAGWDRIMFSMNFDIQAAFYLRGLATLTLNPKPAIFRFIVQETYPPYAAAVFGVPPATLDLGRRKVDYAIRLWRECMAAKCWPGYPRVTCWPEPPAWEEARWLTKEFNVPPAPVPDDGRPVDEQLFGRDA